MKYLTLFSTVLFTLVLPVQANGASDFVTPDSDIGSLTKGSWFTGINLSVSEQSSENPSSLFQQVESLDRISYKVSATGGYFIRDLWMLGGRLKYESSESDTGYSEDADKKRIRAVNRFTSFGFIMRNYLPLGETGRFSLFVETGLEFGFGKEIVQTTLDDDIDRKITKTYGLDLGVTPGLMAFVDKGVAIEASVNIIGLSASWGDYNFNSGERTGDTSSVDLDFSIKLLTLYIGLTYYF